MTLCVSGNRILARQARAFINRRAFSNTSRRQLENQPSRQDATKDLVSSLESQPQAPRSPPVRSTKRDTALNDLMSAYAKGGARNRSATTAALMEERLRSEGMERLQRRPWVEGDVYSPHDLSGPEMRKWGAIKRPTKDVFDELNINPLDEWKNFPLLAEFMTSAGKIKHSRETGLRPVNQRKIAKAIRRAVGMGFHPSVHVHPELLRRKGPWQFR